MAMIPARFGVAHRAGFGKTDLMATLPAVGLGTIRATRRVKALRAGHIDRARDLAILPGRRYVAIEHSAPGAVLDILIGRKSGFRAIAAA